jgi:anti-anti-sigma regulatory factor
MSLEIREHSREDIVILSLKGRITMEESDTLREAVQQLVGAGHRRMLFDLTHVDYVVRSSWSIRISGILKCSR